MAAGTWKLIIEDDAGKQIVVPFTRDVITIGRKEGNTIRLTERNVSRAHAKLSKENGHVVVEDLKSYNGIKLNGDRIDGRVHVHEGDTIQIGDYHLALHAQDGALAGQSNGGGQPTQPLHRNATAPGLAAAGDDDEFAGDTQRWEPPQGGPQVSVPGLATVEDRAISDEHTAPGPVVTVRTAEGAQQQRPPPPPTLPNAHANLPQGGFGADSGDTERVSMDHLDHLKSNTGPNQLPTRKQEPELEPTVRQVASPPPITMPPAAPIPMPAPQAAVSPTSAMPQIGAHVGVLETKPEPRAQDRLGAGAGTDSGPAVKDGSGGVAKALPPQGASPSHPPASPSQPVHPAPSAGSRPSPSSPPTQQPSSSASPGMAGVAAGAAVPASSPRATTNDARAALEEQTEAIRASPGSEELLVPRLVVLNTIFAGSTFMLRAPEAVMGRTEENDITIEHKSVSRNHAKVVREGDRVRILDLKSANGVLVNNEEVEQAVLKSGDVVELGRVKLRFVGIGERFAVAADEIERARLADNAGDDFESDAGTGVTNPVRKKQLAVGSMNTGPFDVIEPKPGVPKMLLAAIAAVIVVALVAVIVVVANRDPPKKTENPPTPPPTDTGLLATNPTPTPPTPPATDTTPPPPLATEGEKPGTATTEPETAAVKADDTSERTKPSGSGQSSSSKTKETKERTAAVDSAKKKLLANDAAGAVSDLASYVKSTDPAVHRTLGVAYAKLKQNDLARKHYKKYLELDKDAPDRAQVEAILGGK